MGRLQLRAAREIRSARGWSRALTTPRPGALGSRSAKHSEIERGLLQNRDVGRAGRRGDGAADAQSEWAHHLRIEQICAAGATRGGLLEQAGAAARRAQAPERTPCAPLHAHVSCGRLPVRGVAVLRSPPEPRETAQRLRSSRRTPRRRPVCASIIACACSHRCVQQRAARRAAQPTRTARHTLCADTHMPAKTQAHEDPDADSGIDAAKKNTIRKVADSATAVRRAHARHRSKRSCRRPRSTMCSSVSACGELLLSHCVMQH